MQIVADRAELLCLGQTDERVFFGDLGQRHGAVDELTNAVRGQVAGRGGGGSLAQKHAQPQRARTRFLERLHLAHAHIHAELIALADDDFGVGGAGLHGLLDHIGCKRFEDRGRDRPGALLHRTWVNLNKLRHAAAPRAALSDGGRRSHAEVRTIWYVEEFR